MSATYQDDFLLDADIKPLDERLNGGLFVQHLAEFFENCQSSIACINNR